jgi:hypothetical protein
VIHTSGTAICECFGISEIDAQSLIDMWVLNDWKKLTSGKEGKEFGIGHIYVCIMENAFLKENERCFLCTHVAQNWENYVLRKTFENENPKELLKILGYNV